MTAVDLDKTTTWGDCPNPECQYYGRMRYGIEPDTSCWEGKPDDYDHDNDGCGSTLRWWDRWHDGEHGAWRGGFKACREQQARERVNLAHKEAREARN